MTDNGQNSSKDPAYIMYASGSSAEQHQDPSKMMRIMNPLEVLDGFTILFQKGNKH